MGNIYIIKSKVVKGINIEGFEIVSTDGIRQIISNEDAIKLARSNKIENAYAVLNSDTGKYMIVFNNGLENLDSIRNTKGIKLRLVHRLVDKNNNCFGYKAIDNNGKSYKLSIGKTWELALSQSIIGIDAKIVHGVKVLKSTSDTSLADIPRIKV